MKSLSRLGTWLTGPTGVVVCLLALTLIYLLEAFKIAPPINNGALTASFFPVALAVVMLLALGGVILADRREAASGEAGDEAGAGESDEGGDNRGDAKVAAWRGPVAVTLLTAVYIALFAHLGYFIATFLYAFSMTLAFATGRPSPQALAFKALVAGVITLLGYGLFELVFQVRLPTPWI
ncbi:tripartite tricarboxylate transporter TctB family protein [Halomonas sp. DP1Y21-3]|uniref:tripartite tricarboxylate transporter TctB family protein n=1 Tax=Halomonas sp. DP1Y21-3 TaxID=2859080 RepID=UPI001C94D407|nr:tripartite tricarboxylate transporter TctB family protein [Halomonas sp. DP1Y21-3]MBY6111013.1 tripartite tricarboxylate transporter TctB family protein [Halomonas sp. DP1Y21-3]